MRLKNNTPITKTLAAPELKNPASDLPAGSATARKMKPISVPIWLTIKTGRRPNRSDRRPSIGAPINWAAA
jgi:hypothetical protein